MSFEAHTQAGDGIPAAIVLERAVKRYRRFASPGQRLRQWLSGARRNHFSAFQALAPCSLRIAKGEAVGLIGDNGAGKSTLLQLVAGTLHPSRGRVTTHGRVAALLELGAGFNPEFTGRENIAFTGALAGLSPRQIAEHEEAIIAFAELEAAIDQPVRTYSSGMFVRLAFAAATQVAPDILIVDEALAVGDGDFSRRSLERILALKAQGTTLLFCSHALYQVESLCERAIWLEHGHVREDGPALEVIPAYQADLDARRSMRAGPPALQDAAASHDAALLEAEAWLDGIPGLGRSADADSMPVGRSGEASLRVMARLRCSPQHPPPSVAVVLHNAAGMLVGSTLSLDDGVALDPTPEGVATVTLEIRNLPLLRGRYRVGVLVLCERGLRLLDQRDPLMWIRLEQTRRDRGVVALPGCWQTRSLPESASPSAPPDAPAAVTDAAWVGAASLDAIAALFERSFAQPASRTLLSWKYRAQPLWGHAVLHDGRMAAFCGALARDILAFGSPARAVQLCDVMVAPEHRGAWRRGGAFYRSVAPILRETVGAGQAFRFMFGFPHQRHARLGIRAGLYRAVDVIHHASWPCRPAPLAARRWRCRPLLQGDEDRLDALWERMAEGLAGEGVIGVRDAAWYHHRFLHPGVAERYTPLLCVDRLTGKALGALVIQPTSPGEWELLDLLGPAEALPQLLCTARHEVARRGGTALWAWMTPWVVRVCRVPEAQAPATDIIVAGSGMQPAMEANRAAGCWWLMGGDTDCH